jgi:hypothetical protein
MLCETTPIDMTERGAQEVGCQIRFLEHTKVSFDKLFQRVRRIGEGRGIIGEKGAGLVDDSVVAKPGIG